MTILNKFKIFNKDVKLNSLVNIFKNYSNKNISQLPVKIITKEKIDSVYKYFIEEKK